MYIDNAQGVRKEYVLVNIVEEFVREKVKEAMLQTEMCRCTLCEFNVCAITLNALPPRYVTTHKGRLLAQVALMNPDYRKEVECQITKAIQIVGENLRH